MDRTTSCLDFAVIGHQDSWQNITHFVNGLRKTGQEQLTSEKVKNTFSFIPPTDVFRVNVKSLLGSEINGVYVETFIDPDKLDPRFCKNNISKVQEAVSHVVKMGSRVATLGGFTSIVLEGDLELLKKGNTNFTTGNTLTAAFIVKGVEQAAKTLNINFENSTVLIIGATGDIGTACATYLNTRVRELCLCARNQQRLDKLISEFPQGKAMIKSSTSIESLAPGADIIISVASSSGIHLSNLKKDVLICDAGYPKNLEQHLEHVNACHVFHGGMGQVGGGFTFSPDYSASVYQYPAPFTIHGCILEAMILAFEKRKENYSSGKGKITMEKIEEIYRLSLLHGITIAPFFNAGGLWTRKQQLHT